MRNAYTAAVVTTLVESGIVFPKAYGISAGAVLAVCYVSQDITKCKATFVETPRFGRSGGLRSFLLGRGFFDTQFVFEGITEMNAGTHSMWDFDFATFRDSPADVHIEAFDMDSGNTKAWTKAQMTTTTAVMRRVEASCSYPLFTPATVIDGRSYVDGGMGASHGICLDAARRDGFTRFFIVRTQQRGYQMPSLQPLKRLAYKFVYRGTPKVYEALLHRPAAYDELLDEIDDLEASGSAYVFYPRTMPITYRTVDVKKLEEAYEQGCAQCHDELPRWKAWLEEDGASKRGREMLPQKRAWSIAV